MEYPELQRLAKDVLKRIKGKSPEVQLKEVMAVLERVRSESYQDGRTKGSEFTRAQVLDRVCQTLGL